MRKYLLTTGFIFFISLLALGQDGKKFPDVQIKTLDGKSVNTSNIVSNHKYTFVSFWATWCGPCKRELDAIAEVYNNWKNDYDLEVVAISIDDTRGAAKIPALVKQKGWTYTILVDGNASLQQILNFNSIPQSYLLDQNGNIIYAHSGYSPGDEFQIEGKIKK
ncbi:MAG TPA: TlpA disulfide reductase family protein [Saprospiraceae bacterium]|nr:TlpA disulfide reductase family protein [Saprospiraceae bacterium]